MKPTIAILLLLFTSIATADDVRVAPGVSLTATVTLVADANGVLQLDRSQPITIGVITPTTPTDPTPTDPEQPADPLAKQVAALVAEAPTTPNERAAISKLFETTAKLPVVEPGQIHQATTILFEALSLPSEWNAWKSDVDDFAGSLDLADTKRAWQLISEGTK